jgi:hypothetical protein
MARIELGMDSQTFWNLTWWDWNLWIERMIAERERKIHEQELEWERQSFLMALMANLKGQQKKPSDFFTPSWTKNIQPKEGKKLSLKEVKKNLGSQFIKEKK